MRLFLSVVIACVIVSTATTSATTSATTKSSTTTGSEARIVGGTVASTTRYPYFTLFFSGSSSEPGILYSCGGTLIREDCVLTAAHCVTSDITSPQVYVGVSNTRDLLTSTTSQFRFVTRVVVHPDYSFDSNNNDIALLFLESPVEGVATPTLNTDSNIPTDGQILKAIGVGDTSEGGSASTDLLEVDLPTVNIDTCIAAYPAFFGPIVNATIMLCAGYDQGGQGTCQGDSGGPYIILGSSPAEDILVGITSFGNGCARASIPDVTTRVSAFQDWISCVWAGACNDTLTSTNSTGLRPDVETPATLTFDGPTETITVDLTTDQYPTDTIVRYFDICYGAEGIVFNGLKEPNFQYTTSFNISTGVYLVTTIDLARDGFLSGGVVFTNKDQEVYSVLPNVAFNVDLFYIIVGNGECPPKYLPDNPASVIVKLAPDRYPNETAAAYNNICTGVTTTIIETGALEVSNSNQYQEFSIELPAGEYVFLITDSMGDGFIPEDDAGWGVFDENDELLYQNIFSFSGFVDESALIVVGGGCDGTIQAPTPIVNTPSPIFNTPSPLATPGTRIPTLQVDPTPSPAANIASPNTPSPAANIPSPNTPSSTANNPSPNAPSLVTIVPTLQTISSTKAPANDNTTPAPNMSNVSSTNTIISLGRGHQASVFVILSTLLLSLAI